MNASASLSFCGQEVRRLDGDRYFCTLFAPAAVRDDLFALYAFNLELARVREHVSQPMLGEIRLQWWRDAIASVYDGAPREHAVLQALATAIRRHDLPRAAFETLIDARGADLDDAPPEDLKALEAYVNATSGGLVRLALATLDVRGAVADAAARHVGIGYGLAGSLRSIPFHARAQRIVIPRNVMAAEGLDPADILRGRDGEALRRTVATVAELARAHLISGRRLAKDLPRRAAPALLVASLATSDLDRLAGVAHNPFARSLAGPGFGRKAVATVRGLRGRF